MKYLIDLYSRTEKITKKILLIYALSAAIVLTTIIICFLFEERIFPDHTTGEYCINELLLLLDGLTSAFIIPVMLFELMYIYLGLKQNRE